MLNKTEGAIKNGQSRDTVNIGKYYCSNIRQQMPPL